MTTGVFTKAALDEAQSLQMHGLNLLPLLAWPLRELLVRGFHSRAEPYALPGSLLLNHACRVVFSFFNPNIWLRQRAGPALWLARLFYIGALFGAIVLGLGSAHAVTTKTVSQPGNVDVEMLTSGDLAFVKGEACDALGASWGWLGPITSG